MATPVTAPPAPAAKPTVAAPAPAVAATTQPAAPDPKPTAEPNPFDELDAKLNEKPKEPDDEPKEPKTDDEPEESTAEPDKPVKDKESRTFQLPKFAREQIAKANAELKAAKEALAEREKKLSEVDTQSKDTTTLAERLAAVERERDAALAEARGLKQEVSPEFREKYEKPFDMAATEAKSFFEQLSITEADGTTRKADWGRDFAAIYNLPEVEAYERAEALFGKHAARVMSRYDDLHKMSRMAEYAKEQERKQWKETQTQSEARAVQQREASKAALSMAEKALRDKYAEWYGEDPTDPEGNDIMKSMEAKVSGQPKSMAEWAAQQARIRLNTVAFPRMIHRLKKANAQIAELKAKLESRENGKPGGTKRTSSGETTTQSGDWDSDLAKLKSAR